MPSYPNPVSIPFAADSNITISCVSNAAYFQRVILLDEKGGRLVTFYGSGENVPMKTDPDMGGSYKGATRQARTFTALFEFSPNGSGGPFQEAAVVVNTVAAVPSGTVQTIGTEDGTDNDNNDTWMTVQVSTL